MTNNRKSAIWQDMTSTPFLPKNAMFYGFPAKSLIYSRFR